MHAPPISRESNQHLPSESKQRGFMLSSFDGHFDLGLTVLCKDMNTRTRARYGRLSAEPISKLILFSRCPI